MRLRPLPLPATLAYTLLLAMGCAGAGNSTGAGGSSSSGTAGTSSAGSAGTTGAAGTTGTAGTTGSSGTTGSGGTTGTGGSVSPGAAGSSTPGTGGVAGTTTGAGGTGGTAGTSASGSAGTTGAGGTTGAAGTTGAGGTGGICQMAQLVYEPKVPTVYLMVDRSGSMFHCLSMNRNVCPDRNDTAWTRLKNAIQTVVMQLQADVRFGFTTIHGTNPSAGGMCPLTAGTLAENVPPAVNNYNAIKTVYDRLDLAANWPLEADSSTPGKKFDSPASYAIAATTTALMNFTAPGDKYIIFITDGEGDFCDDALASCAADATVGALQTAFAANIRTIVFGLQTTQFPLPAGLLETFANAGAGEGTVASQANTTDIWDQCNGVMPWRTALTASGHPTTRGPTAVVGTYATTRGPTRPFTPSAADQNMLVTQLSTVLAGVKSCTFDLSDVGGKAIKVDTTKLNQARVSVQGMTVDLSTTNGWNVDAAAPTQLVLSGTACARWRMPTSTMIDLEFPCGTIIFE